jgi:hypothetical protein
MFEVPMDKAGNNLLYTSEHFDMLQTHPGITHPRFSCFQPLTDVGNREKNRMPNCRITSNRLWRRWRWRWREYHTNYDSVGG